MMKPKLIERKEKYILTSCLIFFIIGFLIFLYSQTLPYTYYGILDNGAHISITPSPIRSDWEGIGYVLMFIFGLFGFMLLLFKAHYLTYFEDE